MERCPVEVKIKVLNSVPCLDARPGLPTTLSTWLLKRKNPNTLQVVVTFGSALHTFWVRTTVELTEQPLEPLKPDILVVSWTCTVEGAAAWPEKGPSSGLKVISQLVEAEGEERAHETHNFGEKVVLVTMSQLVGPLSFTLLLQNKHVIAPPKRSAQPPSKQPCYMVANLVASVRSMKLNAFTRNRFGRSEVPD